MHDHVCILIARPLLCETHGPLKTRSYFTTQGRSNYYARACDKYAFLQQARPHQRPHHKSESSIGRARDYFFEINDDGLGKLQSKSREGINLYERGNKRRGTYMPWKVCRTSQPCAFSTSSTNLSSFGCTSSTRSDDLKTFLAALRSIVELLSGKAASSCLESSVGSRGGQYSALQL